MYRNSIPRHIIIYFICLIIPQITMGQSGDTMCLKGQLKPYEFEGNKLESVSTLSLGGDMSSVPKWCFALMPELRSIILSSSIKGIDENAFFSCKKLINANLNNIVYIGDNCFQNTSLTFIDLSSATEIGEFAFAGCSKLTDVFFSPEIKSIGPFAFRADTAIQSVVIVSGTLGEGAFASCKSLKYVVLRDDSSEVKSISQGAFINCTSLQDIFLPCNLKTIPNSLFMGCLALKHIELPPSLEVIEENAFSHTSIEEITIPATVTLIKEQAFFDCSNLKTAIILNPNVVVDNNAFPSTTSIIIKQ